MADHYHFDFVFANRVKIRLKLGIVEFFDHDLGSVTVGLDVTVAGEVLHRSYHAAGLRGLHKLACVQRNLVYIGAKRPAARADDRGFWI